jgi:predicted component of type VI protein secretion system
MTSSQVVLTTSRKSDLQRIPEPLIVQPDSEVSIGRGHKCDISFPDVRSVSHVHCLVRDKTGLVEIKPVGTNKTFLNDVHIVNDEWHLVRDGSTISLSSEPRIRISVSLADRGKSKKHHSQDRVRRSNAIAFITSSSRPSFEYAVSPDVAEVSIGRNPKSTFHPPITVYHPKIQRTRLP